MGGLKQGDKQIGTSRRATDWLGGSEDTSDCRLFQTHWDQGFQLWLAIDRHSALLCGSPAQLRMHTGGDCIHAMSEERFRS